MRILDTVKIKIKLRDIAENPLAIVTLNLNDEIELRFCPLLWKENRTRLFFTMPSLKSFGFQNCVVILDKAKFKELQLRVIQEFLEKAKDFYEPSEFQSIQKALSGGKEEYVDVEKIGSDTDIPF